MAFKMPSKRTLAKYGQSAISFIQRYNIQGGACKICKRSFNEVRCFIDHEHVKGYSKMDADRRSSYVRGLLCFTCNRYRVAKNTRDTARKVMLYLEGCLL